MREGGGGGGVAGPKGKGNSVCKDPEGRDTHVCTCLRCKEKRVLGWRGEAVRDGRCSTGHSPTMTSSALGILML